MGSVKNGPYAVIENIGGWPLYSAVRLTSSDGPGSAAPNDYYSGFCDITYKLVGPLTPAEVREGKL